MPGPQKKFTAKLPSASSSSPVLPERQRLITKQVEKLQNKGSASLVCLASLQQNHQMTPRMVPRTRQFTFPLPELSCYAVEKEGNISFFLEKKGKCQGPKLAVILRKCNLLLSGNVWKFLREKYALSWDYGVLAQFLQWTFMLNLLCDRCFIDTLCHLILRPVKKS